MRRSRCKDGNYRMYHKLLMREYTINECSCADEAPARHVRVASKELV